MLWQTITALQSAHFVKSLEIQQASGRESIDIAAFLNNLADVERVSGDLDAAERDYGEALRIARVNNNTEVISICTGNLAELALDRADWHSAEVLTRDALSLAEEVRRQELIGSNCYRLSKALLRQGKKVEATPHAKRAVGIFNQLGSPRLKNAYKIVAECEITDD